MIINYPTGFYKSVLPPAPDSKGNYTYTISNEPPPRGSLFFLKTSLRLASSALPIMSTDPVGVPINGSIKSFRGKTLSDTPIRPIGSVIEFNDGSSPIDNVSPDVDNSNDFQKFSNVSTDPIANKLMAAYRNFQQRLIDISQELQNAYITIGNLEREKNTYISSLDAVNQALILEPTDQALLDVKQELNAKISINSIIIQDLYETVNTLNIKQSQYVDSLRSLSKAIK